MAVAPPLSTEHRCRCSAKFGARVGCVHTHVCADYPCRRAAFQLFGSPKDGIAFPDFKHNLRSLGIVASSKQLKALFRSLDVNSEWLVFVAPSPATGRCCTCTAVRRHERANRVALGVAVCRLSFVSLSPHQTTAS